MEGEEEGEEGASLGHGEVVGAEGPGHVEEDSALAAHVLLIIAGSAHTGGAVHGGGVCAALGGGIPGQPDVATLTPPCAPGVTDDPVVPVGGVGSVAHQLHRVVQGDVAVVVAA